MCPQTINKCGDKTVIDFTKAGENSSVSVQGLKAGNTCTYKVQSVCGAPGFKVSSLKSSSNVQPLISFTLLNNEVFDQYGNETPVTGKTYDTSKLRTDCRIKTPAPSTTMDDD